MGEKIVKLMQYELIISWLFKEHRSLQNLYSEELVHDGDYDVMLGIRKEVVMTYVAQLRSSDRLARNTQIRTKYPLNTFSLEKFIQNP
jgi:hypothetical protein